MRQILTGLTCGVLMLAVAGQCRADVRPASSAPRESAKDGELSEAEIQEKLKAAKIDVDWTNTPLADALKELTKKSGVKMSVSPAVKDAPPLTLQLKGSTASQALNWAAKLAGLTVSYKDGGVVITQ